MRFHALLLFVILTCLYLTFAQGSYEDCCLKYVKRVRPSIRKMVTNYREQRLDGGCNIPAIVFSLKRGRVFCADPKQIWVRDLMKHVDKRLKKSHRG